MMQALPRVLLIGLLLVSARDGWTQTSASRANQPMQPPPDAHSSSSSYLSREDAGQFFEPEVDPGNRLSLPFLKHLADDQRQFWSTPKQLRRPAALETFLPFAAGTGLLIEGDRSIASHLPTSQVQTSQHISNYAAFSLMGGAAGAYAFGRLGHNDHQRETGFLSAEAALNGTLITYSLKEATRRERPYEGTGTGSFWHGGDSFPSEHAAIAWSVASIVAHEYPGPLTKLFAYGLASTVGDSGHR